MPPTSMFGRRLVDSVVAVDVRRRKQRAHDRAVEEGHGHGIIVGGTALVFTPPTPVSEAG
jgi:hypothetical protein